MANLQEIQAQLLKSHEQVSNLNQEIVAINSKLNFLESDRMNKEQIIADLQNANRQLNEIVQRQSATAGGGGGRVGALVNLKTMAPEKFNGTTGQPYRLWAKQVKAYCNAAKPGFKKFLMWCESRETPIDPERMDIMWECKESAASELQKFPHDAHEGPSAHHRRQH